MSLSITIGNTSPTRNQPSSSFSRSFSVKEKGKEIEMLPNQHTIDIPSEASSSSQKNEFGKALSEELIDKLKAIKAVSVNISNIKIKYLKKEQSQNKINMLVTAVLGTIMTGGTLGLFAGSTMVKNNVSQAILAGVGALALVLTTIILKDIRKDYLENKKIKQKIQDLRSQPPEIETEITPQQINNVFSEAFDDFLYDEAEKDNKKFVHFFDRDNEIRFVGDVNRIILEHSKDDLHIVLKDNILALGDKIELTKEDFLDVIAQSIIPIVEPYKTTETTERQKSFKEELLKRARGFVKEKTDIVIDNKK